MPELIALQPVVRAQLLGHVVQHSAKEHLVIIDNVVIACTHTQYDLLLALLSHAGEPVSFPQLLGLSEQQPVPISLRRGLTQYISRLRTKLWPFGLDIVCLNAYGYLLFSRPNDQPEER